MIRARVSGSTVEIGGPNGLKLRIRLYSPFRTDRIQTCP